MANSRSKLDSRPKHDPQEDNSKLGPIIKEAAKEAEQKVCGNRPFRLGDGHAIWAEQKRILKEKGINWKSPKEMNPGVMFD